MRSGAADNLKITGNGTAAGGTFDKVKITGQGSINGDVECSHFFCMGEAVVSGRVASSRVKMIGQTVFKGGLQARSAKMMGQTESGGDFAAERLSCTGETRIEGNMRGEEIRMRGSLIVKGSCSVEKLYFHGLLQVEHLLNAGEVDIKLHGGNSRVGEIGGETIRVRRSGLWNLFKYWFWPGLPSFLRVDNIEGDIINIEHVRADVVRGNRVTIGPGCEIGLVEYKESLHANPGAVISKRTKL